MQPKPAKLSERNVPAVSFNLKRPTVTEAQDKTASVRMCRPRVFKHALEDEPCLIVRRLASLTSCGLLPEVRSGPNSGETPRMPIPIKRQAVCSSIVKSIAIFLASCGVAARSYDAADLLLISAPSSIPHHFRSRKRTTVLPYRVPL